MKTLDYYPELYDEIIDNSSDYYQIGWTVCGAQDPAVIILNEEFGKLHPSLAEYSIVRVNNIYLNPWNSDTLLEFSNREMTDGEYSNYEKAMNDEDTEL